jgi:hypothetical protein
VRVSQDRDRDWIAKKYDQIRNLRNLAEDINTTEAESSNAWRRIGEIEVHIRRAQEEYLKERNERVNKGRRISTRLNARRKANVPRFETEWPFGWTRRDRIEVAEVRFPHENKIVIEWDCPGCGMNVERVITPRHLARLSGRPGGVERFIRGIREGKLNQLCDECWEKHQ